MNDSLQFALMYFIYFFFTFRKTIRLCAVHLQFVHIEIILYFTDSGSFMVSWPCNILSTTAHKYG